MDSIVTFAPESDGSTIDCERIPFINDDVGEADDTLRVTIVETRCTTIGVSEAVVTILSEFLRAV